MHPDLFPYGYAFVVAMVLFASSWSSVARADPIMFPEPNVDEDSVDAFESMAQGSSWVSLSGYTRNVTGGPREFGGFAMFGIAFDGPPSLPVVKPALPTAVAAHTVTPSTIALPLTRDLARSAVLAAWRAAGMTEGDERLESLAARARVSALLPEVRTRAARLFDESARVSTSTAGDPSTSDSARANLWLEARLTWRLDRLLFAGVEPAIERMRFDRTDARMRIASKVTALLGDWQKAWLKLRLAPPDSPEALESALRLTEAEASLDVLTGGWFGRFRARPEAVRVPVTDMDVPGLRSAD